MDLYTGIIIVSLAALLGLAVLVAENDRISKENKKSFYFTYAVIAFAALAEWLGRQLNGNKDVSVWILRTVKCVDYILTPIAGSALISQVYERIVFRRVWWFMILINNLFQVICVFTDWMIIINENHEYVHGPLYIAYAALYMFMIVLVVVEFIFYGRQFRKQNVTSLIYIVLFVIGSIALQEFSKGTVRVSYAALTFGVAMMFIHNIEFSQLKADDSLQEQKVKLMLSQIQPHFIYNSLSSISELCETEPKRAQKLVDDFSEYLRSNFSALTDEKPVPFEEQLEQIGFYLNIEKARFGDRINVSYDIRAKGFKLPTLTIQSMVENAVKHGLCKKEGGGTVTIRSYDDKNNFFVEIIDDGVGFDPSVVKNDGRSHVGIENVKKRLEYVGDECEVISKLNVGTIVRIKVPKKRGVRT